MTVNLRRALLLLHLLSDRQHYLDSNRTEFNHEDPCAAVAARQNPPRGSGRRQQFCIQLKACGCKSKAGKEMRNSCSEMCIRDHLFLALGKRHADVYDLHVLEFASPLSLSRRCRGFWTTDEAGLPSLPYDWGHSTIRFIHSLEHA